MNKLRQSGYKPYYGRKNRHKGATLVEYALIVGLISLVIVGVLATPLKDGISTFATNIQNQLTSAGTGADADSGSTE